MDIDALAQKANTKEENAAITFRHDADALYAWLDALNDHEPSSFVASHLINRRNIPRSFSQSFEHRSLVAVIDREFNALVKSKTWVLVPQTTEMKPAPYT